MKSTNQRPRRASSVRTINGGDSSERLVRHALYPHNTSITQLRFRWPVFGVAEGRWTPKAQFCFD